MTDAPHPTLKSKAAREAKKFLVYFIYLWILFALFSVHRAIIFQPADLTPRLAST